MFTERAGSMKKTTINKDCQLCIHDDPSFIWSVSECKWVDNLAHSSIVNDVCNGIDVVGIYDKTPHPRASPYPPTYAQPCPLSQFLNTFLFQNSNF